MRDWTRRTWGSVCGVAVVMLLLSGCGGGAPPPRKTVPVTGTVSLNGKPLVGASIRFIPTTAGHDGAASVSDATGAYKLLTGSTEGVMPGSYKVVFEYHVNKDGSPIVPQEGLDMEQLKMSGDAVSGLPEMYSNPDVTTQMLDVKAGDPVTKNWELKS